MTESEIRLAMVLLDEEQKTFVNTVKPGRWYIGSTSGTLGVFNKKSNAIDHALSCHAQSKNHCKVNRRHKGCYEVAILDIDEDPQEKFYHTYLLEKITPKNILRFMESAICGVLPEEFFEPYSELYVAAKAFSDGKATEAETLQKFKDLGYICP